MSDSERNRTGPSEEELREMLRSLPRRQAPNDFEPELMRRVASIRRRRSILSVLHTAARAEWVGGLVSAALAAVVVAGGWFMISDHVLPGGPVVEATDTLLPRVAAPSAATTPLAAPSAPEPSVRAAAVPQAAPAVAESAPRVQPKQARRATYAAASRRPSSPAARRRTEHRATVVASPGPVDTVTATRVPSRHQTPPVQTSSEAGIHTPASEPSSPAPAPSLRGEPTGVDTGGRVR